MTQARFGRHLTRNCMRAISRADRLVLCGYGRGQIPRGAAMQALGLNDYGELLVLLSRARVPMPIVPIERRREGVRKMLQMLSEHLPAQFLASPKIPL